MSYERPKYPKYMDPDKWTTYNCEWCKKELPILISHKNAGRGRFCSKTCASAYKSENSKIKLICRNCNKSFTKIKNKVDAGECIYCSTECYHEFKIKKRRAMELEVMCSNCNNILKRTPTEITLNNFCNKECRDEFNVKNGRELIICAYCGEEFEMIKSAHGKYCSRQCANAAKRKPLVELECPECGTTFSRIPCLVKESENYCSYRCASTYRMRHNNHMVGKLVGELNPMYVDGRTKHGGGYQGIAKLYLAQECKICGSEDNLHVHHIDGNRNNNTVSNLAMLCSTCHLQLIHNQNESLISGKITRDEFDTIRRMKLTETYLIYCEEDFKDLMRQTYRDNKI